MKSHKKIVVNGDIAIDTLIWEEIPEKVCPPENDRNADIINNWRLYSSFKKEDQGGGALLLTKFLKTSLNLTYPQTECFSPHLNISDLANNKDIIQSKCVLGEFKNPKSVDKQETPVYRVEQFCGFGGPRDGDPGLLKVEDDPDAVDLIVLDDAGNSFRDREEFWPKALFHPSKRPIVILKLSRPLGRGKLFSYCQKNIPDSTLLVLNANDLRDSGINISRQLSWEKTIEDITWHFTHNSRLEDLRTFPHIIVRFGLDGALYFCRNEQYYEIHLYYASSGVENDFQALFKGYMQGYSNAFVAGLAGYLITVDDLKQLTPQPGSDIVGEGIKSGIYAIRKLLQQGFGPTGKKPSYIFDMIFSKDKKEMAGVSSFALPEYICRLKGRHNQWTILEEATQTRLESMAFNLVERGNDPQLNKVPIQTYGPLRVIDRSEIESFQSMKNLISEYLQQPSSPMPLSIAVFGPPGSGKSFAITKLTEGTEPAKIQKIEFNLSQLTEPQDLYQAFHRIRDLSLTGKIPLVFFDEFDSASIGQLGWLKFFLAPMQDGLFLEEGNPHPIGKSIFVFAGGTSTTFQEFCKQGECESNDVPLEQKKLIKGFRDVKGPDFISRLKGYVNIRGPNPVDKNDRLFIIRRALILRALLETHAPHIITKGGRVCIDKGVLNALLRIPRYYHGVRSMVSIINMSMLSKRRSFEQAALPHHDQLSIHVDADEFLNLVESDVLSHVLFGEVLENIAGAIHEIYRENQKERKPENDPAMQPWDLLPEDLKESNRQQASDIPIKLKAINSVLAPMTSQIVPFTLTKDETELLAEVEHQRWVNERMHAGWTAGPERNITLKITPHLVPWIELNEQIKDYDREAVVALPKILKQAGFQILRQPDNQK